jgi:hypothetical protein
MTFWFDFGDTSLPDMPLRRSRAASCRLRNGVHPAWLRFYTVRAGLDGRIPAWRGLSLRNELFMAYNHGVQHKMHAMFPPEAAYCTP